MIKVAIVGAQNYGSYHRMFHQHGWTIVENLYDADLLQFTGGADVSPDLYGEHPHPQTYSDKGRDGRESMTFIANSGKKPMAGICRGGQFLNVMNGGSMYQDVDGHAVIGVHEAVDVRTGRTIPVSSTHHQMMRPSPKGNVLCVAAKATYKEHMVGNMAHRVDGTEENDVEVVLYKDTNCLCFQPHPEFSVHTPSVRECADYYFECLKEIM